MSVMYAPAPEMMLGAAGLRSDALSDSALDVSDPASPFDGWKDTVVIREPTIRCCRAKSDLDDWFVREILPHEAALTRYLRRLCRSDADVADVRQDAYVRVYESAARVRPALPKSFLFAIARNLICICSE